MIKMIMIKMIMIKRCKKNKLTLVKKLISFLFNIE